MSFSGGGRLDAEALQVARETRVSRRELGPPPALVQMTIRPLPVLPATELHQTKRQT